MERRAEPSSKRRLVMAVIGARPATGIGVFLRRPRPRPRPRPRSRTAVRSSARRREIGSISGLLVAIAAAAGLALFYVSQSTHVATTGYEIDALQAQEQQLMRQQQQLVLQIGQARAPAAVSAAARSQLQLVPLDQGVVHFARPQQVAQAAPTTSSGQAPSRSTHPTD